MPVKKRRGKSMAKTVIVLTCITMLNIIGLCYSNWYSDVNITATVYTGSTNIEFDSYYTIETIQGSHQLTVRFENYNHTLVIEGQASNDFKGYLHYGVINKGSIPVQYNGINTSGSQGALIYELYQHTDSIDPGSLYFNENGSQTLYLEAIMQTEATPSDFEITLPFIQN